MVDGAPTLVSLAAYIAEGVLSGGVERCVVVGHSLGGRVAMQLAMDYPELVAAVVSIDAPPPTFRMPRVESMMHERIARLAAAWQSQAGCGRLAMKLFMLKSYQCRCYEGEPARIDFPEHCPRELPEAVADFILRNYVQAQEGWRWQLYWPGVSSLVLDGIGYREQLPFVQPLLLLKGGVSPYCAGVTEELLHSRGVAEHCRVVQFAGEGHFLHIHRRGEVVALLKTLLPSGAS
jgi:alpha/beta hydrolase family protein